MTSLPCNTVDVDTPTGLATEPRNVIRAFLVLGFFGLVSVSTFAVDHRFIYFSAYLWFGFAYGMSLQYGRFCMASAIRDLFAVGVPRMAVGIMIAEVLYSLFPHASPWPDKAISTLLPPASIQSSAV